MNALEAHCQRVYGYSLKEIVEYNLNEIGAKRITKKQRRARVILGIGVFYLLAEVFFFIEYRDVGSFLLLLIMDGFFLSIDVLQSDYLSYKEHQKSSDENQKQINHEANLISIVLIILSFMMTFIMAMSFHLIFHFIPGILQNFEINILFFNMVLGLIMILPIAKSNISLFVKGTKWEKLPISWQMIAAYLLVVYFTSILMSFWALIEIPDEEVAFLFGLWPGFVLTLFCVREIWFALRKSSIYVK